MDAFVVDTSVILKWFTSLHEPYFELAKQLLLKHRQGAVQLHIPLLAFYEIGNVLLHCKPALPATEQIRCLRDLFTLETSVYPITLERTLMANELANLFQTSFYDACFAALAQELGLPLVTADERLCRQLSALPFVKALSALRMV